MAPMELPQWLMISEGLLVVAGFIGVLVSGKKADEVDPPPDDVGVSLEAVLGLDTSARGINRHTKTETVAQTPVSDSKLTNWDTRFDPWRPV